MHVWPSLRRLRDSPLIGNFQAGSPASALRPYLARHRCRRLANTAQASSESYGHITACQSLTFSPLGENERLSTAKATLESTVTTGTSILSRLTSYGCKPVIVDPSRQQVTCYDSYLRGDSSVCVYSTIDPRARTNSQLAQSRLPGLAFVRSFVSIDRELSSLVGVCM